MYRELLTVLAASALAVADPLTLAECRQAAADRSPGVREAVAELEAARHDRAGAVSGYLPQVSAQAGVVAAKDPFASLSIPAMSIPVVNGQTQQATGDEVGIPDTRIESGRTANVVAVAASQTLFAGGRVVNGNRLAALGVDVAENRLAMARRDAVAEAEAAYWTLAALEGKRRVLEGYDTLLAALETRVGEAVSRGLASRGDRLKIGVRRRRLGLDRLSLESGIRLAGADLMRQLGRPEEAIPELSDTLVRPDTATVADGAGGALDRRVELRLASLGSRAEELQLDLEKGALLPAVVVGAQAFRVDIDGLDPVTNAMVYGMVSVPISDLWKGGQSVGSHRAKLREARVREADLRRRIGLGLDKARDDLERAERASRVADEEVEQAEVGLAEEDDRFRNGLSTVSDLLEAQALLQEARSGRLDAWKDYWTALRAYERATGKL